MGKKISYEEVKNYIESFEGYQLISEIYINATTKLIIKCPNGHITPKSYNSFKNGVRCKECHNETLRKLKQTPIDIVYELVKDRGYTFVSWLEEYRNNTSKMLLRCSHNHEFKCCYAYLKDDNYKCTYCFGNKRLTINYIREEFSKRDYKLISTKYINAHEKLEYICNKHPEKIQKISWNNFSSGKGCKPCGVENQAKQQLLNQEKVFRTFKDKGLIICDDEEYKGVNEKMKCVCLNHPNIILNLSYGNILKTKFPCKNCYIDAYKGENSPLWKGGTSLLHDILRGCIQEWKNKSMEYNKYRCVITGEYFDIIHHTFSFNKIVDEVFNELKLPQLKNINEYSQEQIDAIKITLLNKHYDHGYGVPLCHYVHNLFHKLYGKYDNSPWQFEEFKQDYLNGKYKDLEEVS